MSEPKTRYRLKAGLQTCPYLTLILKNCAALEGEIVKGEVAVVTLVYGPVTMKADCRVPTGQVS